MDKNKIHSICDETYDNHFNLCVKKTKTFRKILESYYGYYIGGDYTTYEKIDNYYFGKDFLKIENELRKMLYQMKIQVFNFNKDKKYIEKKTYRKVLNQIFCLDISSLILVYVI